MVSYIGLLDIYAHFAQSASTSILDRTIYNATSEYTMSTKTRTIHHYETSSHRDPKVATVVGEEERILDSRHMQFILSYLSILGACHNIVEHSINSIKHRGASISFNPFQWVIHGDGSRESR